MVKKRKFYMNLIGAVIFLSLIALATFTRQPEKVLTPKGESAFLNARWGMSQLEVEQSNGRRLHPMVSSRKFYTVKEGIKNKTRYKAMQEESGRRIFGRESEISYIFFDDKLFSYHVFVRDREPLNLDQDMRNYLMGRFGHRFISETDDKPLKMIWNQKTINVNYWLYEDDLSLSDSYVAGYGVVYRPIEEAIPG